MLCEQDFIPTRTTLPQCTIYSFTGFLCLTIKTFNKLHAATDIFLFLFICFCFYFY